MATKRELIYNLAFANKKPPLIPPKKKKIMMNNFNFIFDYGKTKEKTT